MWIQMAVIGSVLVTVVLVISSVRVGFTFLVAPILVCESLLLALACLLRQVLADEDEAGQTRGARQAPSRGAVPPPEPARPRAPESPSPEHTPPVIPPDAPGRARHHDKHAA